MKILLIEDDRELAESMRFQLEKEGYETDICDDGEEGLYYMKERSHDLVILDRMLPSMDGITVLQEARKNHVSTPVIMLTALGELQDKLTGLKGGADDYMVKPFAFEELLARIRVLLRKPAETSSTCLQTADLKILLDTHQVFRGNTEIRLSGKEFSLLRYMMQNEGIVLSRDKLEQHIWNYDFTGGSNVIDVYIRYLRRKIDDGFEPKLIHTIRGTGYVLKVAS